MKMGDLFELRTWSFALELCCFLMWAGLSSAVVRFSIGQYKVQQVLVVSIVTPFALLVFIPLLQSLTTERNFLSMAISIVLLNLTTLFLTKRALSARRPAYLLLSQLRDANYIIKRLLDDEIERSPSLVRADLERLRVAVDNLKQEHIDVLK